MWPRTRSIDAALPARPASQHWICVFQGRSGAHARALFETKDQAAQFAERHARIVAPDGTPLKWEGASDSSVSTTTLGDYLVAPIPED